MALTMTLRRMDLRWLNFSFSEKKIRGLENSSNMMVISTFIHFSYVNKYELFKMNITLLIQFEIIYKTILPLATIFKLICIYHIQYNERYYQHMSIVYLIQYILCRFFMYFIYTTVLHHR